MSSKNPIYLIGLVLLLQSYLFSTTYYVDGNLTGVSCTQTDPCERIQTAIDLATTDGDIVIVAGGMIYEENLLIETGITLKSAPPANVNDPVDPAIIDGSNTDGGSNGSCIIIRSPSGSTTRITPTVQDMIIRGGTGTLVNEDVDHDGNYNGDMDTTIKVGGGILVHNASLTSRRNNIKNNGSSGTKEGGAVYVAGSGIEIEDDNPQLPPPPVFNTRSTIIFDETVFEDNTAQTGHTLMVNAWDPVSSRSIEITFPSSTFDVAFDSDDNQEDGVSEYWVSGKDDPIFDFSGDITGRYQAVVSQDVYVDPVFGVDEDNTSGSIEQPFKTIEYAMSMVYSIDPDNPVIINVVGTINSDTESFPIVISSSVTLYGFEGSATLDARGNSSVLLFVNVDYSTVISNLTITGGYTDSPGGGIVFLNSNPTLTHVTISGNTAEGYGGGMYLYNSDPTLTDVIISGNSAGTSGGGVYSNFSDPIFDNVIIEYNSTTQGHGGGIYLINSSNFTLSNVYITNNIANGVNSEVHGGGIAMENSYPTLSDVTLSSNSAVSSSYAKGGGIYCGNSDPILNRVLLNSNSAKHGGGLSLMGSTPIIRHATISGNNASSSGGGIHIASNANLFLINSILWDNGSTGEIGVVTDESTVTYSDIQGGWDGEGNINEDPLFTNPDPESNDFTLQDDSPCIGTGEDGTDMGAFEFGSCTTDIDCEGVCGGAAVVDECGVCGGDGSDDLGCGCFELAPSGCDNVCGSTLENDECDVCGGDGSDDLGCGCFEAGPSGCDNTCGSTLENDECDVCGGDGSSCGLSGDLNGDGLINVLDVVALVNIVLGYAEDVDAGDLNGDGALNVLDIVIMVDIILNS